MGVGRAALDGEPVRPGERGDRRPHPAGEPGIGGRGVPRVDREALAQDAAARRGGRGEGLDLWPRPFGVHVVGRDGRDPAPVVDPRIEEPGPLGGIGEVRRRLHADVRAEHDPRRGDRREERLVVGLGSRVHRGAGLRPEVLDDDLLDVVVPPVDLADREQGRRPLARVLADADEDPRRERDGEAAGVFDRAQAHRRDLVRRPVVGAAGLGEPVRGGLEHQAHRRAHLLQARELLVGHDPRVEVRQQARRLDHVDRRRADVVERAREPALVEPRARRRVPLLGPVAEREEGLLAPRPPPRLGDRDDLLGREVGGADARRRLRERAVVAAVAAEHRERDEDLAGVGDRAPPAEVAQTGRRVAEARQVLAAGVHQRGGLVEGECLARLGAGQGSADRVGGRGRPVGHGLASVSPARPPFVAGTAAVDTGPMTRGA